MNRELRLYQKTISILMKVLVGMFFILILVLIIFYSEREVLVIVFLTMLTIDVVLFTVLAVLCKISSKNMDKINKMNIILEKLEENRRERVVIHTLRHTFASQLAIIGTPIFTIQRLMGHKDINMTLRYAKLSPDVGVDAVEKLEGKFIL